MKGRIFRTLAVICEWKSTKLRNAPSEGVAVLRAVIRGRSHPQDEARPIQKGQEVQPMLFIIFLVAVYGGTCVLLRSAACEEW